MQNLNLFSLKHFIKHKPHISEELLHISFVLFKTVFDFKKKAGSQLYLVTATQHQSKTQNGIGSNRIQNGFKLHL